LEFCYDCYYVVLFWNQVDECFIDCIVSWCRLFNKNIIDIHALFEIAVSSLLIQILTVLLWTSLAFPTGTMLIRIWSNGTSVVGGGAVTVTVVGVDVKLKSTLVGKSMNMRFAVIGHFWTWVSKRCYNYKVKVYLQVCWSDYLFLLWPKLPCSEPGLL